MPVSLKDFAKSLAASGLMSTEEVRDFLGTFPAEKRPKSSQDLARELIRAGKITKYQAMEVYHGRTKGLVLGNYVILDKIGAGGMGQVFKARHKVMKRMVAIKVLPPAAVKSEQSIQRFQREVEAAAKLIHQNIVIAHDADQADGVHFLVMEQVDGSDLSHIVSEHGPLPVDTAVDCIIQAAKGLEYAHKQGVIHRDIKPANVLVDKEGTVKILDMGLARVFEEGEGRDADRLTDSGQVMGTCDYMAPEQAEDTRTADHRADIYSLGCTLYRIVTGKKPYEGGSLVQILMAHRAAPIPSLCEERPDVPASLEAAYQKMMAKTPEDRYQSMSEVIGDLEACVSKERQPMVGEASSDSALTAFLQNLSDGGVAIQKKVAKVAAETVPSQTDQETGIGRKLVPVDRHQRKLFAGVAAGALFLVVLLGVVLSLRTPDGTLIVEINEDDAVVQVLDEEGKVEIERKGEKGKLSISVDPGKHRLKVEKDGFSLFTKDFEIESGGEKMIGARLESVSVAEDKGEMLAAKPPSSGENFALEFAGKRDYVKTPVMYDGSHAITVEFCVPQGWGTGSVIGNAQESGLGFRFAEPAACFFQVYGSRGYVRTQFDGENVVVGCGHHIAGVFDGSEVRLYVDGHLQKPVGEFSPPHEASRLPFFVGVSPTKSKRQNVHLSFHGTIDEVRISSVARYAEDFTLQRRFEPDEHAMALYHFDEGTGDVLKDSSGNGHDGQIVGAKWVKVDEGLGVVEDDPDRRAAEWVLGIGGAVKIAGASDFVKTEAQLPHEGFVIDSIDLGRDQIPKGLPENWTDKLTPLQSFVSLDLNDQNVSDEDLYALGERVSVTDLRIRGAKINDYTLRYIAQAWPQLEWLNVASSPITDAGLKHISRLSSLQALYICESHVTDAGLPHLKSLTNLTNLGMTDISFTAAGVADLQAALPNCKIGWDSERAVSSPMTEPVANGSAPPPAIAPFTPEQAKQPAVQNRPLSEGYYRIAFESPRGEGRDIYLINADGTGEVRLSDSSGDDKQPCWSPDGKRIAFNSNRDGNTEVYVMNADGSGQTNLTNHPAPDGGACWFPDGDRIAFVSSRDGMVDLYSVNADGTGVKRLTTGPDVDWRIAVSPDGAKIAYVSGRGEDSEIYVMTIDGSGQRNLTSNSVKGSCPCWSPDGERIAFISEKVGNREIHVMNADGTRQVNLTNSVSGFAGLSWSPDGKRIAFISNRDGNNEVYVMNVDGSGQERLTNTRCAEGQVQWSPDGKRIAFVSGRDGDFDICVMNADGSDQTILTDNSYGEAHPSWCPVPEAAGEIEQAAE